MGDQQRADKTLPEGLSIRRSGIKGAQYGAVAMKPLPKRLRFGPYEGVRIDAARGNGYTWQVLAHFNAARCIFFKPAKVSMKEVKSLCN